MSVYVPARENGFGDHEYRPLVDCTAYYATKNPARDGQFTNQPETFRVPFRYHHDQRYTTGNSPRKLIPGTQTEWRAPNSYERSGSSIRSEKGTWVYDNGWYTVAVDQPCTEEVQWNWIHDNMTPHAFQGSSVIWSTELESEAIAKAIAKIKDQKLALGEDLGEAVKTYHAYVEEGVRLLRAAVYLKQGNLPAVWGTLRHNQSAIRRGADIFLQYKYGWKPLMEDIYALDQLFREKLKKALIIRASAKSQREDITPLSGYGVTKSGHGFRQCQVHLYGLVDSKEGASLMDKVGLSNPLSLGWNLAPWTFVSDWFVPVGTVLDSWTAPLGVKFLGGTGTMKGELEYESRWEPPLNVTEVTPRIAKVQRQSVRRTTYGDWPKAGFFAVNPFKAASAGHGQSALALLIQKLKLGRY